MKNSSVAIITAVIVLVVVIVVIGAMYIGFNIGQDSVYDDYQPEGAMVAEDDDFGDEVSGAENVEETLMEEYKDDVRSCIMVCEEVEPDYIKGGCVENCIFRTAQKEEYDEFYDKKEEFYKQFTEPIFLFCMVNICDDEMSKEIGQYDYYSPKSCYLECLN